MELRPLVAMAVLVAACSGAADPDPVGTDTTSTSLETTATQSDSGTTATTVGPSAPETSAVPVTLTPTPAQQEGPYYPIQKPMDRDNDLTELDGSPAVAQGQVLIISGFLRDTSGQPVQGATIEIWQTDVNGIYLHPGDPGVDEKDPAFQSYGEAVTQADGSWAFRTINPGYYEPRPRHIHFKIVIDNQVVLTSQIYFSDDPQAADIDPALVATVTLDEDGATLLAEHPLVVDN